MVKKMSQEKKFGLRLKLPRVSQRDEEPVSERDNCEHDSDISRELLTTQKGRDLLNVSERLLSMETLCLET